MARQKERDWIKVNFNLDPEIKEKIEELSKFEGVSQSNFIEVLVSRWDEGINPQSKLNTLFKERDLIVSNLNQVENQIKNLTNQISAWNITKKEKAKRIPEALKILSRLISINDIEQAEKVAKFWQTRTGVSSFELLIKAKESLTKHLNSSSSSSSYER